ncbi:hypothetical protein D1866_08075 [Acidianus ambivalens]|uniref:Tr-type G domain-containing protein n=2 Tax=Acidianus ambivalens TaxID=2283 RepID=A0A650CWZ4_ACIAM|nr:GTP-binding protein [Acidianus ambivalens]QGR21967.1 hypothetical protein D1866_08075 [Acidianus ambivalens]
MYLISLLGNGDTGKTTSFAKFLLKNNYFLEHQEEAIKNAKFDAEINGKPEDYYQFLLYISPQEKIEERTIYTAQKIMAYHQGKFLPFRTISYLKFTGEKYERVIVESPYKDGFAKGYITFSLQDIGGQFDLFDKQINGLRISDAVIYFADDKTTQKDAENHAKMISAFKLPTFVVINKEDILKEKAAEKMNMILTTFQEHKINVIDKIITSALYKEEEIVKFIENAIKWTIQKEIRIYDKNVFGVIRNVNRSIATVRAYSSLSLPKQSEQILYTQRKKRFYPNRVKSVEYALKETRMMRKGDIVGMLFHENPMPSIVLKDTNTLRTPITNIHLENNLEEGDILYSSMVHSIKDIKYGNILLNEGISVNELFVINPEKRKIKEVYDLSEFF